MSQRIEEWLERMRKAENPGPVTRISAVRSGREVGWIFDVYAETNLADLAERIDNACRDAGFAGTYELRALDAEGHFIGPFAHKAQVAEIVPMGSGLPMLSPNVEETVGVSLRQNRAFAALGLDSIMKAQRATERLMACASAERSHRHDGRARRVRRSQVGSLSCIAPRGRPGARVDVYPA